ncbi:hypothetical protein [Chryseobacterium lathyri]|uniref:hypothetical protein n=1 Tax=Chryseobacterium lathyri TaxID=395933 RepID=UPI001CBB6AF0|nr:hypothetical protein [Chryseobacterium lathyri]
MKRLFLLVIMFSFFSCMDGPRAVFNEDFIQADPKKELSFEKLVGEYSLDDDSKRRYGITYKDSVKIIINKDSTFIAENYLDYKTDSLLLKKFKGKLSYINDFEDFFMDLRSKNDNSFNGAGGIDIYYRKKDSIIALYISTPFIPATKENKYKYKEGDYLRYIKVK